MTLNQSFHLVLLDLKVDSIQVGMPVVMQPHLVDAADEKFQTKGSGLEFPWPDIYCCCIEQADDNHYPFQ